MRGRIDGHDAHGAGGLAAAEEAAAFSCAAHRSSRRRQHAAHIAGVPYRNYYSWRNKACRIWRSSQRAGGSFLRLGPVKILGDGIGGDGMRKPRPLASPSIMTSIKALLMRFISRLAVAVGEVHGLAAHDAGAGRQVGGYRPVQRDVGKRSLRSPSGWAY